MTEKVSVPIRCHYDDLMPLKQVLKYLDKENANSHTQLDIEDMSITLMNIGWEHPIVIATHPDRQSPYIQYGNKRALAAQKLGFTHVPIVSRTYDNADIAEAANIADNAHGQRSKLNLEIINVKIQKFDPQMNLKVLGIKDLQIDVADRYTEDDKKPAKAKNCPHCGEKI